MRSYNIKRSNFIKLSIVVAAIFATLFAIEIGMRFLGMGILAMQESANEIRPADAHMVRILTIGESTTADSYHIGSQAWPRQLERKLLDQGIKVRIYNVGRRGTITSWILSKVSEQLDYYKPHIVISMMGINDKKTVFSDKPKWWNDFWIAKFNRWWTSIFFTPRELPNRTYVTSETIEAFAVSRNRKNTKAIRTFLDKITQGLSESQKVQQYLYFADKFFPLNHQLEVVDLFNTLRLSLSAEFRYGDMLAYTAGGYARNGKEEKCRNLAKEILQSGWRATETTMITFWNCSEIRKIPRDAAGEQEWKNLLMKLSGAGTIEESSRIRELTKQNYQKLNRLLSERNIVHIAMQYPTRSIAQLTEFFSGPNFQNVLFVENKRNFEDALKTHPFSEVFVDNFAGDFGHTTQFGHDLIADAAAPAVKEAIQRLKLVRQ